MFEKMAAELASGFAEDIINSADMYIEFKTNAFIVLFAIPISYMYLFAWTSIVKLTGSVWSARFWFFGMSYFGKRKVNGISYPAFSLVFQRESSQ